MCQPPLSTYADNHPAADRDVFPTLPLTRSSTCLSTHLSHRLYRLHHPPYRLHLPPPSPHAPPHNPNHARHTRILIITHFLQPYHTPTTLKPSRCSTPSQRVLSNTSLIAPHTTTISCKTPYSACTDLHRPESSPNSATRTRISHASARTKSTGSMAKTRSIGKPR